MLSVSRRVCLVVARPFLACPRARLLRCCQYYALLALLVSRRLRRLLVGLSCCWMCSAMVAFLSRFCLFRLRWAGTACFGGASPPSWWGVLCRCLAVVLVGRVLGVRKLSKTCMTYPAPPWSQRYMHNPSSCTSWCPSAVLSVSLVPIVCTAPSVAKPLWSSSVHPRVPYGSPGCWPCVVVRCSCSCPLASCVRWCVRRCLSAVAGGQGDLAWWHAGL